MPKAKCKKKTISETHQYVAGQSTELALLFDHASDQGRSNIYTLEQCKGEVENMLFTLEELLQHFDGSTPIAEIEDLEELDS